MEKDERYAALLEQNERFLILINVTLTTVILTLVAFGIVQFIEYISPGWQGQHLIIAGVLIALEAQFSSRRMRKFDSFSMQPIFYRISELVVLLLFLRLFLYLVRGFDSFLPDLISWREDFFLNFFSGEYILLVVLSLFIWICASFFTSRLVVLEGDVEMLKIEVEGQLAIRRIEIRRDLAVIILILGVIITGLYSFMFIESQINRAPLSTIPKGAIHLIIYFLLGLIWLSLTQFSILRVQWIIEAVPFNKNLVFRWLIISFLVLTIIAFIATMLPTGYSIDLIDFLRILFSIVLWILWLIAFVITLPFAFLLSLLFRIMGKQGGSLEPIVEIVPRPPQPEISTSANTLEWLKSLFFWIVLISIISLSLVYFIKQNKLAFGKLSHSRFFYTLKLIFAWLRGIIKTTNKKINELIESQLNRIKARQIGDERRPINFLSIRKLTPRQKILFYYHALLRRASDKGLSRKPAQTPNEYAEILEEEIKDSQEEIQLLTEEFIEARYSQHVISIEQANVVKSLWDKIKKSFKSYVLRN